MKGAPILITTLNRHVHFIRLVESLKRNTWAKYTPVYVALDYPPSEKYLDGYNKINEYLGGSFDEFYEFNVIRRSNNYGSARNMAELREFIFERYNRFIRTDDDAEFSPNFLEYMNKCLDEYESDEHVIAVTGYSYPLKWHASDNATIFKQNFICPMWGTGFWKSKYRKLEEQIVIEKFLQKNARSTILNRCARKMTDMCCQEFVDLCLSPDFDITLAAKVTDVSVRMYMAICDKFVVMPTISKVRNWGFDGTGEFCNNIRGEIMGATSKSYLYHLQPIDDVNGFILSKDSLCETEENKHIMNDFDPIPSITKLKMYLKMILYILLGNTFFSKTTLYLRSLRK